LPWLFNIFVDNLLQLMNKDMHSTPLCIFYTDDGMLIVPTSVNVQALLDKVKG